MQTKRQRICKCTWSHTHTHSLFLSFMYIYHSNVIFAHKSNTLYLNILAMFTNICVILCIVLQSSESFSASFLSSTICYTITLMIATVGCIHINYWIKIFENHGIHSCMTHVNPLHAYVLRTQVHRDDCLEIDLRIIKINESKYMSEVKGP